MARACPTVVVFARAPLAGATKTRLAAAIGDAAARRFHAEMLAQTVRALADPRWRLVLAVTPDRFARRGRFWPRGIARVPQGPGDLGRRMARALAAARPGRAGRGRRHRYPRPAGRPRGSGFPGAGRARCGVRPCGGRRLLAGRAARGEPGARPVPERALVVAARPGRHAGEFAGPRGAPRWSRRWPMSTTGRTMPVALYSGRLIRALRRSTSAEIAQHASETAMIAAPIATELLSLRSHSPRCRSIAWRRGDASMPPTTTATATDTKVMARL